MYRFTSYNFQLVPLEARIERLHLHATRTIPQIRNAGYVMHNKKIRSCIIQVHLCTLCIRLPVTACEATKPNSFIHFKTNFKDFPPQNPDYGKPEFMVVSRWLVN